MVSYTLITLATAAAVSAQAAYGSSQNQTQVDCYIAYNTCRSTRVNGASANQAACAASYAGCLGFSPFNSDGTNTVTPSYTLPAVSRTSSATTTAPTQSAVGCVASYNKCRQPAADGTSANQAQCAAENAACKGACQSAYDTCRVTRVDGASANQAFCASQFASCLGENPFVQSSSASAAYTTQVVTAYTTVCPSPTTFTHGPSTYTVSTSTTITLPCPGGCTITTPVAPPATTAPAPPNTQAPPPLTTVTRPSNNAGVPTPAASTTRAVYTGAASPMQVGGSGALLLGALGLFVL